MSYIGAQPTTASFPFDQFSGNGSTTAFTLTYAPASTTSIIVAISGVVQNPNLYSVIGTTITFSPAPPTGTNNISVLYLGLPVIGVSSPGNTAYFSSTSFTATASQTTFTPSGSYQVGFINVIRNGSQLAPADYTATNGTTVVLNNACTAGDIVVIEVYTLTSISNALPLTGGTVTGATTFNTDVTVNGGLASGFTGFKNRIINGAMVIDQRNAGASVTPTDAQYTLDRWFASLSQASKFTVQQNAGSVTPPAGFNNYLGITVGASANVTVGAGDYFSIAQYIEGFNVADLGFGAAGASTVTLSFWVRSSLTGTFGGSLRNSAANRNYPFPYTISSANTWEQKSITIAGDTTGTWLKTNGNGLALFLAIGVGSTYTDTAGAWTTKASVISATGATNLISTNGATFYITGVQLERGSNATSFEFRDYGRELALCQRYFETSYDAGIVPGTASILGSGGVYNVIGSLAGSTSGNIGGGGMLLPFKVSKRTNPTIVAYDFDGTANAVRVYPADAKRAGLTAFANIRMDGGFQFLSFNNSSGTAINNNNAILFSWTASAEL
jgi:hypothetical protein